MPDRIAFDLKTEATAISEGTPASFTVDGRFLYGAPAAGAGAGRRCGPEAGARKPGLSGFVFGLADEEETEDSRTTLDTLVPLDAEGKAQFEVDLGEGPATTKLLEATVAIRMQEPGGRAVERSVTLPVTPQSDMIGIKTEFTSPLPTDTTARFTVITVGPDGARKPATGLTWKLLRLERNYQWYRDGTAGAMNRSFPPN